MTRSNSTSLAVFMLLRLTEPRSVFISAFLCFVLISVHSWFPKN